MTSVTNNVNQKLQSQFILSGKTVRISYTLHAQGLVNISLYNSKGAVIKTVMNKYQSEGDHSVLFNCNNLNSGVYYCKMTANNKKIVEKFVVSK